MSDDIIEFRDMEWSPADTERAQNRLLRKGLSAKSQCNRTVCTTSPAPYFNESTRKFYCEPCAKIINHWSMKDWGKILCKKE